MAGPRPRGPARAPPPRVSSHAHGDGGLPRPVVLVACIVVGLSSSAASQEPSKADLRSPEATPPISTAEPAERQPYRIIFHFACHPSSDRPGPASRPAARLAGDGSPVRRRPLGGHHRRPRQTVLDIDLEGLDKATPAQAAAFEKRVNAGPYDKVWVVHADRNDSGIGVGFTGRTSTTPRPDGWDRSSAARSRSWRTPRGPSWNSHSISSARPPRSMGRKAARPC